MNLLNQKRIEFLENIANFYNSKNRSVVDGKCLYSPTKNSPGCAIGREIKDKSLTAMMDKEQKIISAFVGILPDHLKELGLNFLKDCQRLHDDPAYWNDYGLSAVGKVAIICILNDIKSGIYDL